MFETPDRSSGNGQPLTEETFESFHGTRVPAVPELASISQSRSGRVEDFSELASLGTVEMRTRFEGEERFYLSPEERIENQLVFRDGHFYYLLRPVEPFDTVHAGAPGYGEGKGIAVVSAEGQLLATTKKLEGIFHHSTLVGGEEPLTSFEIATTESGKPLYFTYRSGHYPHGPYRLKAFLEQLVPFGLDVKSFYVSLDERDERHQRNVNVPLEYFLSATEPEFSGSDLVLQFLLNSDPESYVNPATFGESDYNYAFELETPAQEAIGLVYTEEVLQSACSRMGVLPADIVERLIPWIQRYTQEFEFGIGRVPTMLLICTDYTGLTPSNNPGVAALYQKLEEVGLRTTH
jgi:hypothetical protein